jgi:hypothetical protein
MSNQPGTLMVVSRGVRTPPGGHFIGAVLCTAVIAGMIGLYAGIMRLAASNGPEDDVDKATETSIGNWGLAIAAALVGVAVLLWIAGQRRGRDAEASPPHPAGPPPPAPD